MPRSSDYVTKACTVGSKDCKLSEKCKECKKEINDLKSIDLFFQNVIGDAEKLASSIIGVE